MTENVPILYAEPDDGGFRATGTLPNGDAYTAVAQTMDLLRAHIATDMERAGYESWGLVSYDD